MVNAADTLNLPVPVPGPAPVAVALAVALSSAACGSLPARRRHAGAPPAAGRVPHRQVAGAYQPTFELADGNAFQFTLRAVIPR